MEKASCSPRPIIIDVEIREIVEIPSRSSSLPFIRRQGYLIETSFNLFQSPFRIPEYSFN